ncbi:stealth family protein [Pasteurella atlantica]|uniref:stealth family protein n=1 Tax=Pasteurellaceae TaxID=712 RepID=UPI002757E783|nr:stealth family protein [Pasteurella atlantica]MDP8098745.1 stealth family protein [Pasteurella atlantica]MDP8106857.1 stealth family protein [Pasteurella atlantica]MDP8116547.1 stealth family protein [Pasteurella atlantica]
MKIDFVLPWVDPTDKQWQKRKESYAETKNNNVSNSQARYRDMETLKYVLRAIEQNCPWYNKIFLMTEGHFPKWLNLESEKVRLVTHEEMYFDKTHLPTFNSSSIEMNLANIPDLSEHFVYLNDDTVIMRETPISRFFVDGKAVDFLSHGWIPRNKFFFKLRGDGDSWSKSVKNTIDLINTGVNISKLNSDFLFDGTYSLLDKVSNFIMKYIYKRPIWITHWHHPQSYTKKTLNSVCKHFKSQILENSSHRFRSEKDIAPYLYRYWHLLTGDFYPRKHQDDLPTMNIDSVQCLENMFSEIKNNKNIRFVCFNDVPSLSDEEYDKVKKLLVTTLESYFPNKASFEK